ncbi:MAG: hypothetical protein H6741_12075 [Alphaproteobacteria bacterium]|nr:hypothetical protein [Alphaproteobacteria bacterium]
MHRRRFLVATAALALSPRLALAKRPPKILLHLQGTLSWRDQPVYSNAVALRFALFDTAMARNPLWAEEVELKLKDGLVDLELGKRAFGDMENEVLPETVHLQVQVLSISGEAMDAKLSPRLEIDWRGEGRADCLDQVENISSDPESGCVVVGAGNLRFVLSALDREPKPGTWPPPE